MYSEEFDVEADTPTHAKQKAEEEIAKGGFTKGLYVRRVRRASTVQVFSIGE